MSFQLVAFSVAACVFGFWLFEVLDDDPVHRQWQVRAHYASILLWWYVLSLAWRYARLGDADRHPWVAVVGVAAIWGGGALHWFVALATNPDVNAAVHLALFTDVLYETGHSGGFVRLYASYTVAMYEIVTALLWLGLVGHFDALASSLAARRPSDRGTLGAVFAFVVGAIAGVAERSEEMRAARCWHLLPLLVAVFCGLDVLINLVSTARHFGWVGTGSVVSVVSSFLGAAIVIGAGFLVLLSVRARRARFLRDVVERTVANV